MVDLIRQLSTHITKFQASRPQRLAHYRLRVLLYAGRPNWDIIDTIDPAQIR